MSNYDNDGFIKAKYHGKDSDFYFQIIKSYLNFIQLGEPDLVDESLEPFDEWWNEYISDEENFVEEGKVK